jgi:protein gp37
MATDTSIEWADKTWSPIIGCDRVSEGCRGCYAISQARIRSFNPHPAIAKAFAGTVDVIGDRVDWTGQINQLEDRLTQPLSWRKPAKVFVNSLSDLFHKNVDNDFIVKVFAIMALTPQHTYQLLTKRHARMRSVLNDRCTCGNGHVPGVHFRSAMAWAVSKANPNRIPGLPDDAEHRVYFDTPWPLPNLHLGVSVEDQHWADIRIPALLDTPAAVRWISAEPLLGPIDLWGKTDYHGHRPRLTYWLDGRPGPGPEHTTSTGMTMHSIVTGPKLDWVVAGGETGPGARPPHPDWFRTLRNQCAQSGTPFLFKQWGDWGPMWPLDKDGRLVTTRRGLGVTVANDGTVYQPGDLAYPDGPRYGEALRAGHDRAHLTAMYRLGKKKAGRELDGRTHDQFPEPR